MLNRLNVSQTKSSPLKRRRMNRSMRSSKPLILINSLESLMTKTRNILLILRPSRLSRNLLSSISHNLEKFSLSHPYLTLKIHGISSLHFCSCRKNKVKIRWRKKLREIFCLPISVNMNNMSHSLQFQKYLFLHQKLSLDASLTKSNERSLFCLPVLHKMSPPVSSFFGPILVPFFDWNKHKN